MSRTMIYEQTITLGPGKLKVLNYWLTDNSGSSERLNEDDVYSLIASFPDAIDMDIKCCGTQEGVAWTEAVLFKDGSEISHTDVSDEFLGDWELEYNDNVYRVHVVEETNDNDNK